MTAPYSRKMLAADLALLSVALVWGVSFTAAKTAQVFTGALELIFLRFTLALLVLAPLAFREIRQLSWRELLTGASPGLLLALIFAGETYGVALTSATHASFLISLFLIFTPLMENGLHGRLPPGRILGGAALCVIGTGALGWDGGGFALNAGDLLILAAAFFRGMMMTASGRLMAGSRISSLTLTSLQLGTVGLVAAVALAFSGNFRLPLGEGTGLFWLCILFLSGFSTLAAFFIQNIAIRMTSPTRAGFLMGSEPLFGVLAASLLLAEAPGANTLLGGALILAGTGLGITRPARPKLLPNQAISESMGNQ